MKVGIIGCGLIGEKRALSINKKDQVTALYDPNFDRSKYLSNITGAKVQDSPESVINSDAEIIFVATTHNLLAKYALKAINAEKHVLIEKPGACSSSELKKLIKASKKNNTTVKVGFNHRFHPAISKAHEILKKNNLGEIIFIRGRYGHGGRVGYETEWRCNKKLSCGGELLDQGSHLIDLSIWFMGDLTVDYKMLQTYFWDTNVEDNCFLALKNKKNNLSWLHASWTEWKNCFSLEIYTKTAKFMISGLGGSYGAEKLTYYKMSKKMGIPSTEEWVYKNEDVSWGKEYMDFKKSIKTSQNPCGDLNDALKVMKLVEKIYTK